MEDLFISLITLVVTSFIHAVMLSVAYFIMDKALSLTEDEVEKSKGNKRGYLFCGVILILKGIFFDGITVEHNIFILCYPLTIFYMGTFCYKFLDTLIK